MLLHCQKEQMLLNVKTFSRRDTKKEGSDLSLNHANMHLMAFEYIRLDRPQRKFLLKRGGGRGNFFMGGDTKMAGVKNKGGRSDPSPNCAA